MTSKKNRASQKREQDLLAGEARATYPDIQNEETQSSSGEQMSQEDFEESYYHDIGMPLSDEGELVDLVNGQKEVEVEEDISQGSQGKKKGKR